MVWQINKDIRQAVVALKKWLPVWAVMSILSPFSQVLADADWTDYGAIEELNPTARHYYLVKLDMEDNPSGCDNKLWFYQDYSALGADQMFATLLESLKSKLKVRVYVSGRCNLQGYSEITSVSVRR